MSNFNFTFCLFMRILKLCAKNGSPLKANDTLFETVFIPYLNVSHEEFSFDHSRISKYLNCRLHLTEDICMFYSDRNNRDAIVSNIKTYILPEIHNLAYLNQLLVLSATKDAYMSDSYKSSLIKLFYACRNSTEANAKFLAELLCFTLEKTYVPEKPNSSNLPLSVELLPDKTLSTLIQFFTLKN